MTNEEIKAKIHAYQARMDGYHFRLPVTLVPSTAWGQNLRNTITQSQWQFLRLATFRRAQHHCQGCGAHLPNGKFHAHELWHWDTDTTEQRLIRLVCLCEDCHLALHWGYANTQGLLNKAIDQFLVINEKTYSSYQVEELTSLVQNLWQLRSKLTWTLNVKPQLDWLRQKGIR